MRVFAVVAWAVGLLISTELRAEGCEPWAARVVSLQGSVEVRPAGTEQWQAATADQVLCDGDTLHVAENARAAVLLPSETVLRLDQDTTLTFTATADRQSSLLDMLRGVIHAITRVPRSLEIRTPFVNAAVEGTEFLVTARGEEGRVSVFEGHVAMTNPLGRLVLASGENGVATAERAPSRVLMAHPREAVQWALYFPPVVDLSRQDGPQAVREYMT